MPEINKIPEVLYEANQPYHFHYDNLPLKNILKRIDLVNAQVDINADILRGCSGSVGTLSNRLDVSINDDGSLKSNSVNESLHNIAYHSDGSRDDINYVVMKKSERDKLDLIEDEANRIEIQIEDSLYDDVSLGTVNLSTGVVKFESSNSILFDFEAPNIIKAHSAFPPEAAHKHHYNITPAYLNSDEPDNTNFITTLFNTPFMEGSLRVYVNGIRIGETEVPVPDYDDFSSLTLTKIESYVPENGRFTLNRSLSDNDIILIDFDEILTI
jgi:hypothetical protein